MAINLSFPDDPQAAKPEAAVPLEYSNPLRKPVRVSEGPPEDLTRYTIRRLMFALGAGLLLAGVGNAYVGYDRSDVAIQMGFGAGLVALTWKPWRLGA